MKQARGDFEAAQDSDDSAHELYYFEDVYVTFSKLTPSRQNQRLLVARI